MLNCGNGQVQSEAASEPQSWVSYDLKDFQPATEMVKAGEILPSVSTTGGSNTPSASSTHESQRSRIVRHLFIGPTEEQCAREAAMYQSQSAKESSRNMRDTLHPSLNLISEHMKYKGSVNGGFDMVKATPPKEQDFLYDGSEFASSKLSQDNQQHLLGLNQKEQKRQEVKEHVIGATQHLVETCNENVDATDEVVDEIPEFLRGKSSFANDVEDTSDRFRAARRSKRRLESETLKALQL
ncbi:MAG: hypothetical protein Q9175_002515 [Cornicularia normoerica]